MERKLEKFRCDRCEIDVELYSHDEFGRRFYGKNCPSCMVALRSNRELWATLRSPNHLSERFCNELSLAKSELRRRGFAIA